MIGNIAALVAAAAGLMPAGLADTHRYYGRHPGSRSYTRAKLTACIQARRRANRVRNRAARHARRVQRMRGAR